MMTNRTPAPASRRSTPMRRGIGPLLLITALLVAACVKLPAGSATRPAAATTPQSGGTLHYGLTLPVSGIDPHIHASNELGIALNNVYDTLVVQDRDGQFYPSLAASWSTSPDGLTYTFVLRQDVTFHDGTAFNAQAVLRNLQRIADPATKSQKAIYLLGPFDHAEAVDAYTVKLVLKTPYAPLLDGLSQVYLGMASPQALDKWGDQYQLHQVGTGPFRFVSYQDRQTLVIERNPDYRWAPTIRKHGGAAYLDRVEFRFYADAATRLPALLAGQADVMGELPTLDAAQLAGQAGFTLLPTAIPGQSVQFFLNTQKPPLDDLQVRQALAYATDRAALVQAVFGPTSPVAHGPLAAVTRGAVPASADPYTFDLARARALLAQAGWADSDGDGILDQAGQKLTLQGVLMSWGELPAVGTILQAQWRAAGIDLALEQMPYPAALEAGRTGAAHLIPFANAGTDASLLRTFFHSANIGGFNWSRVADAETDGWLDAAGMAGDWTQRAQGYAQVQERALAQAWIVPIRDPVNLNAAAARVQDLSYDVQGWFPVLYDVWLAK